MNTGFLRGTPLRIKGGDCYLEHLAPNDRIMAFNSDENISETRVFSITPDNIEYVVEIETEYGFFQAGEDVEVLTCEGILPLSQLTSENIVLRLDEYGSKQYIPIVSVKRYNVLAPVFNIELQDFAGFFAKGLFVYM